MRKIGIKLQDRPVDPGGPVEREQQQHTRGAHRDGLVSLGRAMAAATSAAISMEMRWMSAISYDKISAQKRRSQAEPGPAPSILQPRKQLLLKTCTLFSSFFLCLSLSVSVSLSLSLSRCTHTGCTGRTVINR